MLYCKLFKRRGSNLITYSSVISIDDYITSHSLKTYLIVSFKSIMKMGIKQ